MPTTKILNLCRQCIKLLDGFNYRVANKVERGVCEMCGAKGDVQAVRIDGKATHEQRDSSVPEEGLS